LGYLAFLGLCQLISKSLLFLPLSESQFILVAGFILDLLIDLDEGDVLGTLEVFVHASDECGHASLGLLSVLDDHLLVDEVVLEDLVFGGDNSGLVRGGDEVLEEVDVFHPGLLDLFKSSG